MALIALLSGPFLLLGRGWKVYLLGENNYYMS